MTARENARITRALYDRFNLRDFESGVLLVEPSATWTCMQLRYRGFSGYREMARRWIDAFPDWGLDIVNLIATNEWVAAEYVGAGRHEGDWRGPGLAIPASGNDVRIRFCEVLRVGRRIEEARLYFDRDQLYEQMGLPTANGRLPVERHEEGT